VYHHEDGEGIHVDEDTRSLHKTETERRDADPTKLDNHDHLNGAVDMEKTTGAEDSSISSAKERGEAAEPEGDNGYRVEKTYEEIRPGIPYQRDVEAPPVLKKTQSTRLMKDPNLVAWESDNDLGNPKNWSMKRKWAATFIVSAFTLVSPISSSMIAPALNSISADFGITNEVEAQLTLSIFILAYAIGPLFLGPLSEIYGRVLVLQLSNLFYLAWNLGCGFARTSGQLMAFRFLSGLGGSAPLAIGGVSIPSTFGVICA